jgi:hypothetical protein
MTADLVLIGSDHSFNGVLSIGFGGCPKLCVLTSEIELAEGRSPAGLQPLPSPRAAQQRRLCRLHATVSGCAVSAARSAAAESSGILEIRSHG